MNVNLYMHKSKIKFICNCCNSKKLEKIWTGHCRSGGVGNYSKNISNAFQCSCCDSIYVVNPEEYDSEKFTNGDYRKSVDNSVIEKYQNFFVDHKDITLTHLSKINPSLILDKNVLDFGCGSGLLLDLITKAANSLVGIELDKSFHRTEGNLSIVANISEARKILPEYDLITSFFTLPHLKDVKSYIIDLASILKPGGTIIIGTLNPNDFYLKSCIKSYENIFFRENCPSIISEQGLIKTFKLLNFQHVKTEYFQRFGWSNYLSFLAPNLDTRITDSSLSETLFKTLLENSKMSDYFYIEFKKNNE